MIARTFQLALLLLGWLSAAFVGAFVFEVAVVAGSSLRSPPTPRHFETTLLADHHGAADVVTLVARNIPLLAAMALVSWSLARVWRSDHAQARAGRAVYAVTVAGFLIGLWWILTRQAAGLSEHVVSPSVLLLALPHGPLEFAALFLPLVAAVDGSRRGGLRPTYAVGGSVALALPLLVCAAFVETFVSPLLFTISNLQR